MKNDSIAKDCGQRLRRVRMAKNMRNGSTLMAAEDSAICGTNDN